MAAFEYCVMDVAWPNSVEDQSLLLRSTSCADWHQPPPWTRIEFPYLGAFVVRGTFEICEVHIFWRGPGRILMARTVPKSVLWVSAALEAHKKGLKTTFSTAFTGAIIGTVYVTERTGLVQVGDLFRWSRKLVMRKDLASSGNQRMILLVDQWRLPTTAVIWRRRFAVPRRRLRRKTNLKRKRLEQRLEELRRAHPQI